jgi:hypothetical protein
MSRARLGLTDAPTPNRRTCANCALLKAELEARASTGWCPSVATVPKWPIEIRAALWSQHWRQIYVRTIESWDGPYLSSRGWRLLPGTLWLWQCPNHGEPEKC